MFSHFILYVVWEPHDSQTYHRKYSEPHVALKTVKRLRIDTGIFIQITSEKFCNILVCTTFQRLYHVTDAVQAMEYSLYGW